MKAGTRRIGVNAGTIRRICAEVREDRKRRPVVRDVLMEIADEALEVSDRVKHGFLFEGVLISAVRLAAAVIRLIEEGDSAISAGTAPSPRPTGLRSGRPPPLPHGR